MLDELTPRRLGWLGIALYATHAGQQMLYGFPQNLLWYCHLGTLLSGAGLALRSPALNGVGLCWLAVGTPSWLIGLAFGGSFHPTSLLTHLGGLAVAVWGVRQVGFPRGVWWKALGGMALLHLGTRPLNPAGRNVNFAGGVWKGFDAWFPSHGTFLAAMLVVCGGLFLLIERALRRWPGGRDPS